MGIFDRIIRKVINKTVDKTVDRAANNAADKIAGEVGNKMYGQKGAQGGTYNGGQGVQGGGSAAQGGGAGFGRMPHSAAPAYFEGILRSDFKDFEIKKNVPAESLSSAAAGKGYLGLSFVLYRGGRPAAAVMLTAHNKDRSRAFYGAKDACEKARIPFINFYTHYPNEHAYVTGRIRSMVK